MTNILFIQRKEYAPLGATVVQAIQNDGSVRFSDQLRAWGWFVTPASGLEQKSLALHILTPPGDLPAAVFRMSDWLIYREGERLETIGNAAFTRIYRPVAEKSGDS